MAYIVKPISSTLKIKNSYGAMGIVGDKKICHSRYPLKYEIKVKRPSVTTFYYVIRLKSHRVIKIKGVFGMKMLSKKYLNIAY